MNASIEVKDLTKVFALAAGQGQPVGLLDILRQGEGARMSRVVHALNGVSFRLHEGERVGVIGRNGAGKTTLMSILADLTKPTAGAVDVTGDVHAMLTIGAVLREDLTGRENIMLDAAMHGRTEEEIDAVAEDIVAFSELDAFIERPVRTYSSGMKARLAFSMGAFIDPDILILDETLAVGDAFFSKKASRRMKEIAERGRIVVMVTQSSDVIVDMCTRCLWLDDGRLKMDGDPKVVTAAYEASVRDADEAVLKKKFGAEPKPAKRPQMGCIRTVDLLQDDERRETGADAMKPLIIRIRGELSADAGACDLVLSLMRVDGRQLWRQSLKETGQCLPSQPAYDVEVRFDPFILGDDLYRLDVRLADDAGPIDAVARVFEVVDKEGQFGGRPMLLHPATMQTRSLADMAS